MGVVCVCVCVVCVCACMHACVWLRGSGGGRCWSIECVQKHAAARRV